MKGFFLLNPSLNTSETAFFQPSEGATDIMLFHYPGQNKHERKSMSKHCCQNILTWNSGRMGAQTVQLTAGTKLKPLKVIISNTESS